MLFTVLVNVVGFLLNVFHRWIFGIAFRGNPPLIHIQVPTMVMEVSLQSIAIGGREVVQMIEVVNAHLVQCLCLFTFDPVE